MGRPNKFRKKVTLKKKRKGNILNLRIGKVLRRDLLQQKSFETSKTFSEQSPTAIQRDQNLSESVLPMNCETEDLIKELLELINKQDDSI